MFGWKTEFVKYFWQLSNRTQDLLDSSVQDLEVKVVNATQNIINTQSSELSDRTQALLDSRVQDLEVKVVNAIQNLVNSFKIELTEKLDKIQRENREENLEKLDEIQRENREENLEMQERMTGMQELIQRIREETKADITSLQERFDVQLKRYFDCSSVPVGSPSGLFNLFPHSCSDVPVEAYCELEHDEGWTVILNRIRHEDASKATNFNRTYREYQQGFGVAGGDFWAGLDNIHSWTSARKYELRVDLTDFDGNTSYAIYDHFSIGGDKESYKLHVGGYSSGNAGNSLDYEKYSHQGMKFTTYDRDQDRSPDNCAQERGGGWWYTNCGRSILTGPYKLPGTRGARVIWFTFNEWSPLREASMKIRPARN